MKLKHVARLYEERADSRIVCLKQKIYIDNNCCHFIKEYLEQFSKFVFQDVACPKPSGQC